MDIRSVIHSILPLGTRTVEKTDKAIRTDSATDRDGNGQMPQKDSQNDHPPISDEQFKKAQDYLRSIAAVKEHQLLIEEYVVDNKKFVLIKEIDGKVLRRVSEQELWTLIEPASENKGQLLRKTA